MDAKQLLNALRDGAIVERIWRGRTVGKPKYKYIIWNVDQYPIPTQASTLNAIPTRQLIVHYKSGGTAWWQYNFWTVKLTPEQLIALDCSIVLAVAVPSALYADSGFVRQVDGQNRLTPHAYAYWRFLRSQHLYISREGTLISEDEMYKDSIYAK